MYRRPYPSFCCSRRFQACMIALTMSDSSLWSATSLSLPQPPTKKKPIQRVAVIGAGIAGLSVAHCLTNSPNLEQQYRCEEKFDVSIFDSRPYLDTRAGAGVQLNGGLSVLGKINPIVQRAVMDAGLPQVRVQCRTQPWEVDTATARQQPFDTLFELDLPTAVAQRGGDVAASLMDDNQQLLWIAIMRGSIQQALMDTLPETTRNKMQFDKDLIGILPNNNGKGALLQFADGSTLGPFDLVVGCDGIKSACKEYIERGRISEDAAKREGAAAGVYSGIRIKYAVRDGVPKEEASDKVTLTQYFGNGAFALDGTYGAGAGQPSVRSAFLIYLDDKYIGPFRKRDSDETESPNKDKEAEENADWTQDVEKSVELERTIMLDTAQKAGVPTLDVGPTIASADRIFSLGVYYHNPFSLVGWSKEIQQSGGAHVVLVGDAAHALPPFLGQGSNQAIQDAYCLATKLYEYNTQCLHDGAVTPQGEEGEEQEKTLQDLFKSYEDLRWRPTFDIFFKSIFLGYLETGGTNGVYAKFRDVFFKTMGFIGVAERVLFGAAVPKV